MTNEHPQTTREQIKQLAELAKACGGDGIWLIHGAQDARLIYKPDGSIPQPQLPDIDATANLSISLAIADADLLVVMRFPSDGGKQSGIEYV